MDYKNIISLIEDRKAREFLQGLEEQPEKIAKILTSSYYSVSRNKSKNNFFNEAYVQLNDEVLINFGPGSFNHPKWINADKLFIKHRDNGEEQPVL